MCYFSVLGELVAPSLGLHFLHRNDIFRIWAQLMKWSSYTLVSTPIRNIEKFLKLNIWMHFGLWAYFQCLLNYVYRTSKLCLDYDALYYFIQYISTVKFLDYLTIFYLILHDFSSLFHQKFSKKLIPSWIGDMWFHLGIQKLKLFSRAVAKWEHTKWRNLTSHSMVIGQVFQDWRSILYCNHQLLSMGSLLLQSKFWDYCLSLDWKCWITVDRDTIGLNINNEWVCIP